MAAAAAAPDRRILKRQQADGSFRYSGEYGRGHLKTRPALLRQAGGRAARGRGSPATSGPDAAVRTLEYIKRFQTPRGGSGRFPCTLPINSPRPISSGPTCGLRVDRQRGLPGRAAVGDFRRSVRLPVEPLSGHALRACRPRRRIGAPRSGSACRSSGWESSTPTRWRCWPPTTTAGLEPSGLGYSAPASRCISRGEYAAVCCPTRSP